MCHYHHSMLQSYATIMVYRKTAQSLVNALVLSRHGEFFSYYGIFISRMKYNFWQSLNKFCYDVELTFCSFFSKFTYSKNLKLNFAKSCISFCLSKFQNKKKFHRAEIIPTCSPVIWQFFDTMIVASIDRVVIMTHQNLSLGMCLSKPSCTRVPKTWRLCLVIIWVAP